MNTILKFILLSLLLTVTVVACVNQEPKKDTEEKPRPTPADELLKKPSYQQEQEEFQKIREKERLKNLQKH